MAVVSVRQLLGQRMAQDLGPGLGLAGLEFARVTEGVDIDVATSAPEAFALFQDYSRRLLWDPFLCEAFLLDATSPESE